MTYAPRHGRVIAGQASSGQLHVREHAGPHYTVERGGYACGSVEVLCSTVSRERVFEYFELERGNDQKARNSPGSR